MEEDKNDESALQKKHQAMMDRLSTRHQSRIQDKVSDSSPSFESTDTFLTRFTDLKQSITSKLTHIEQSLESFTKTDLDTVSSLISDLEKLLAENSYHLPSYDVRASLKTVSDLRDSLENVSSKLAPRKKFSFKNKKVPVSLSPPMQEEQVKVKAKVKAIEKEACLVVDDTPGFRNREGEILIEDLKGKKTGEFTLSNLTSCEVRLPGQPRAIFIHKLRNCKIYAGPTLGSVLIDDAEGCVFVLASHQIRIHNARECDFYLRVRSRPIIEDSSPVRFAPYCLKYEGIEDDLRESRLDEETGNWGNVDDFKWLRALQSPNWSVLPENERLTSVCLSNADT